MHDDETDILAAQAGDEQAFGRLVQAHEVAVRSFVASYVGDPAAVFDIAQEAFVAAWNRLDRLNDPASFGAWLRGIARNAALMHLRTRLRRQRNERAAGAYLLQARIDALEQDDAHPALGELQQCLDELARERPRDFELIDQRYLRNAELDELAERAGVNQGTLRTRLHRARVLLRQCLEQRSEAWS